MSTDINQYRRDSDLKQYVKWLEKLENKIEKIEASLNSPPAPVVNVSASPSITHRETTGKGTDDHHDKDHQIEHKTTGDDQFIPDGIQFDIAASPVEFPGLLYWNLDDDTFNIVTSNGQVIQVGQELAPPVVNKTGAQLDDGTVVYIEGADVGTDRPKIVKADASTWETSQMTIGLCTIDILNNAVGPVTVIGYVRGVNTDGMTAGDSLYLSETAGEYTNIRPVSPAFIINIGIVVKVGVSDGVIYVHVNNNDDYGFHNRSFVETFDCLVSEAGGVVTASLQRTGGGNLTMRFSTGPFTTLVTAPMTKVLVPGTVDVPKRNFLYILESDQTQMTLSNVSYPASDVEHIQIAEVILLTAAITALDDPLANQNVNDHAFEHLYHLNAWVRAQPATYEPPGIAGNSSTGHDYFEIETVPDKVYFRSTAGTVRQMHLQVYPVKDTGSINGGGSDIMYVINDPDQGYTRITDLIAGITKISDGTLWGNNKHIGLFFFGIISKTGEGQQIACLLPDGQYNSQLGAENDLSGFTNTGIPDIFRGTGFPICKIVCKKVGATIEYESTKDLRSPTALLGGGTGGVAIVDFPDNTFNWFNVDDPTKRAFMDASAISPSTDRTIVALDATMNFLTTAEKAALHAIYVLTKAAVDALRITELGTVTVGDIDAIANYIANTDVAWAASIVSQAEAEAGVATTERKWTAERVKQAIVALGAGGFTAQDARDAVEDSPFDIGFNGAETDKILWIAASDGIMRKEDWANFESQINADNIENNYQDPDAVNAIEGVANAPIATGDSVIFKDVTDGVLKQDLVSDLISLVPADQLGINGLSSYVQKIGASICFGQYTPFTSFSVESGAFTQATGANFLMFNIAPPDWLIRYAVASGKTITATTVLCRWDNRVSADYITHVTIMHAPYDSSAGVQKYNSASNLGLGSIAFRLDTFNFTDVVMDHGDWMNIQLQVQQGTANSCRIKSFEMTYTLA